jgi:hypothetical protein
MTVGRLKGSAEVDDLAEPPSCGGLCQGLVANAFANSAKLSAAKEKIKRFLVLKKLCFCCAATSGSAKASLG